MPEMNGHNATLNIRNFENDHGGHVPIVALTASAFENEKEMCFESGMDDYITKPITATAIHCTLNKWLHIQKYDDTGNVKENECIVHDEDKQVRFDKMRLMDTIKDDKTCTKLSIMALGSVSSNLEDIVKKFAEHDMQGVKESAHQMKGVSLNIGFNILASMAKQLEETIETGIEDIPEMVESIEKEIDLLRLDLKKNGKASASEIS